MQFIGGRYVWGGFQSLHRGGLLRIRHVCLCPLRLLSAPQLCGLGHCGKGVSYSNAQMGDVICYQGHCGLYIGGGKMVNALGVKYGIVVSKVNTGRLVAVRRII